MKKTLSLTLGVILMVPQPVHAETPVTDVLYAVLKGTGQATTYLGGALWTVTCGVGSVAGDLAGRAAADLGMRDIANSTLKIGAGTAAVVGAAYGAYWLNCAKTRQELKGLKKSLKPEIPTVEAGLGKKAKYRIFNWKLNDYPTAGKLKEIRNDRNQLNNFLNDLASDVINNEFNDINPRLCTNTAGQPVMNMYGVQLTQEAARQIIMHIDKELPVLQGVIEGLKGHLDIDVLAGILEQLKRGTMTLAEVHGAIAGNMPQQQNAQQRNLKKYVASQGFPIKKWVGLEYLFGLKGNAFAFNYAEEYKEACKRAGYSSDIIPKPTEMSPEQYRIVDEYMNECAKTTNNKIKFARGYVYYAQAARLYWNTYKKIHRLEAIANLLNAELHGLAATNRPVGQIVYIR
jgi:hypothetical protein